MRIIIGVEATNALTVDRTLAHCFRKPLLVVATIASTVAVTKQWWSTAARRPPVSTGQRIDSRVINIAQPWPETRRSDRHRSPSEGHESFARSRLHTITAKTYRPKTETASPRFRTMKTKRNNVGLLSDGSRRGPGAMGPCGVGQMMIDKRGNVEMRK